MPSPCAAETGSGSPRPRAWNSWTSTRSPGESILFAATTTGSSPRRRIWAISWSPGRSPARASTTSSATWASAIASRAWSWIETASGSSSCEVDAAGVDQRQPAAVPLGAELLAVARDAGALVHDRLARLGEPVDERGLADVRVADDGDLHRSSRASTASVANWPTTSSSVRPVVSTGIGVRRGLVGRAARACRRARRARPARAAPRRGRRRSAGRAAGARSSGSAVRKTLTAASGATTVAMSRPSATQSPSAMIACCLATSTARTAGSAATRRGGLGDLRRADRVGHVAAVEQHAVAALDGDPLGDLGGRPRCSRAPRPTARYIAPVSR